MIPVRLIYLSPDPDQSPNREFDVEVYAVPRIGEQIMPQAGTGRLVVTNVIHTLFTSRPDGGAVEQRIHVVVKEAPPAPSPPPRRP